MFLICVGLTWKILASFLKENWLVLCNIRILLTSLSSNLHLEFFSPLGKRFSFDACKLLPLQVINSKLLSLLSFLIPFKWFIIKPFGIGPLKYSQIKRWALTLLPLIPSCEYLYIVIDGFSKKLLCLYKAHTSPCSVTRYDNIHFIFAVYQIT